MGKSKPEKPVVFISHIKEERTLGEILKRHLGEAFLGMINFFLSSDGESIELGEKWLSRIENSLSDASVMLVLCSKESVGRPWVNFEAGAGWVKGIPLVPVCHTGQHPAELPVPMNMRQGFEAGNEGGLKGLVKVLSKTLGCEAPRPDYAKIITEVNEFEVLYGKIRDIAASIEALIAAGRRVGFAGIAGFFTQDQTRLCQIDTEVHLADNFTPYCAVLQDKGILRYRAQRGPTLFSSRGTMRNPAVIAIELTDEFYALAPRLRALLQRAS